MAESVQNKEVELLEVIGVEDKLPLKKAIPLSVQHLFAMFGSSVLVPILLNIDPATVLFFNGIGTLLYAFITKRKIPAYLGSSFAFISPVLLLMGEGYSFTEVQSGFVVSGLLFATIAIIVGFVGTGWIRKLFPPASMGAIVTIIGLELAPTAADMAGFPVGLSNSKVLNPTWVLVSMITIITVILASVLLRGFLKVIPILIGIVTGYLVSCFLGLVDFTQVKEASLFVLPQIHIAKPSLNAILTILPATFVVVAEHVGHLVVTSSIVALTKVYSSYVICGAGVLSVILGFSGSLSALIRSIPTPVIGGVSLLLFGTIATSGLRTFIEEKVDYSKSKNLILTSVTMIVGLSNIAVRFGAIEIKGMGLATIVAMILSISFMIFDKLGLMNEK